jgi:hypothetical protein
MKGERKAWKQVMKKRDLHKHTSGRELTSLRYPGVENECLTNVAPSLRMPTVGWIRKWCFGLTRIKQGQEQSASDLVPGDKLAEALGNEACTQVCHVVLDGGNN